MYAENQSDKYLTLGGLKVLGNVESQNISQIKRDVQETFDKTQTLTAQQKEYWNELANDNLITPVEKKQVKQELAIIEKTYTAIIKKAEEHGQEFNPLVTSYARAYRNLKDYFNEVKLFDNMTKSTTIDKIDFNAKYAEYYEYEAVVQSVFLENQTYSIRVLSGLDVAGQDGEIAIYRNGFYRWTGEKWQLVGGGNYLGCFDYIPEANIDDFFLVREDFTGQIKYKSNGKFLKSNGKYLVTSMKFKKGFIYKLGVRGWEVIELKSDHRYFVATEDLLFIGESITTNLQDYVSSRAPKYLGAVTAEPEEKTKGDYFTWAAESTEDYTQGKVYKWNGEAWEWLDPENTKNNQQFMTALTDILKTNATGEGYFSTVFTESLIAHTAFIEELAATKAFIEKLQSQVITLTQALNEQGQVLANTGIIQSKNFLSTNGAEGWQIKADGTAIFKHVTLDYIKSANAELTDSKFSGELNCGNLQVKKISNKVIIKTYDVFNNYGFTADWEGTRAIEYLAMFQTNVSFMGEAVQYITSIFGKNTSGIVEGKKVIQLKINKYQSETVLKSEYLDVYAIYDNGQQEKIYQVSTIRYIANIDTSEKQIKKLEIHEDRGTTKQLLFENLSTQEPTTTNVVWAGSDGILRIKK